MAEHTNIQWCDSTVNPSMGCDGCELWDDRRQSCYAGVLHGRRGKANSGFAPTFEEVTPFPGRMAKAARWSDLRGAERPGQPWLDGLPRLVFVSDMGDSLSNAISFEYLKAEVIDVATSTLGSRHVWQWLTKRPARMADFSGWLRERRVEWPSNVWVGTSITTQPTLKRVKSLLRVGNETTIRFLSVEPQIEPIELDEVLGDLDWIIQGGESGEHPRPFDMRWARSLIEQCKVAGVPYFLKQLGAAVVDGERSVRFRDSHGGDWDAWPEDLRVREIPRGKGVKRSTVNADTAFAQEPILSTEEASAGGTTAPADDPAAAPEETTTAEATAPGSESSSGDGEGFTEEAQAPGPSSERPTEDDEHEQASSEDPEIDSKERRQTEDELDDILRQITTEKSQLAFIKLLPRAKKLYEELNPTTKHGGARKKQDPENGSCEAFVKFVADRAGVHRNTIYNYLDRAAEVEGLDPEAEALCYGCGLANDIGFVTRIARIPKKEFQRDIANIYRHGAGRNIAKKELEKWEDEYKIPRKQRKKKDEDSKQGTGTDEGSGAGRDDQSSGGAPGSDDAPTVGDERADTSVDEELNDAVERILAALGVNAIEDCVPAIDALKAAAAATATGPEALKQAGALQATVHELRVLLAAEETKTRKLEAELAMYTGTPLADLFRVLGATNAKQALSRARSLAEGPNASS